MGVQRLDHTTSTMSGNFNNRSPVSGGYPRSPMQRPMQSQYPVQQYQQPVQYVQQPVQQTYVQQPVQQTYVQQPVVQQTYVQQPVQQTYVQPQTVTQYQTVQRSRPVTTTTKEKKTRDEEDQGGREKGEGACQEACGENGESKCPRVGFGATDENGRHRCAVRD